MAGTSACASSSDDPAASDSALSDANGDDDDDDGSDRADALGTFRNISTSGAIDHSSPFFKKLGTNGRSCSTCHRPGAAFALDLATVQGRFDQTHGEDPLFRPVDGANRPDADVSTFEAKKQAYSLLLSRGTFRFEMKVPADAEFTVDSVSDPYGFATPDRLSLYRRPLMSSNLEFVVGTFIMWDGREASLASQASDATVQHAQASAPPTPDQLAKIVAFESSLFSAQTSVTGLGSLLEGGATGGPVALSQMPFALNTNAPQPPPTPPVTRNVFTSYASWANDPDAKRQAVARGEDIFNNRVFGNGPPPLRAPMTCTLCHSSINVGNNDHSGSDGGAIQATGTSGEGPLAFPNSAQFLAPDLPTYTLKRKSDGAILKNNDPGRAVITGKWNDVGRFKTPSLRALAARAPYFHNGMAKTLLDVVNFYDKGKAIPSNLGFTDQEKADLVAFLSTL